MSTACTRTTTPTTVIRLTQVKDQLEVQNDLGAVRQLAAETQDVIVEEHLDWSSVIEFQDLEFVV